MGEDPLVHLFTVHYVEVVTGIVAIVGAVMLILSRFGWLHFGKRPTEDYKMTLVKQCTAHKEFADKLSVIHDNQIKNNERHNQHQRRFDTGEQEIKKLKSDIKQLCIGVAILLERTGGKPKSFTELD